MSGNDDGRAAPKDAGGQVISRRALCAGAGGAAVLLGMGALRFAGGAPLVRPPGGQDEARLTSMCVRCQRCYEACPREVIVPAHLEDGFVGARTPTMEFNADYCDFCARDNGGVPRCVRECPAGALSLPEGATAQSTVIGLAVINERECLAYRNTGCRFCYDACPYEAIELVGEGARPLPRVVNERCNGCGACESVCVSLESGSIAADAHEYAITVRPLSAIEEV